MENPTFRRAPDGTLILKASPEAQALGPQQGGADQVHRAKKPEEVDAEAWALVSSQGGDTTNATLVLSRYKVQFGKYQGRTFHWLLENDLGYAVSLVASHQEEHEKTDSRSPSMANKDALKRYSSSYPEFAEAVRFHRAFLKARLWSLQPGQEGKALVGFGDYKFDTLQSVYESKDPKKIRFVKYLRGKMPAPGTQMDAAVRYVKKRDRQQGAATSSTTSTTASTCSSASVSTTASPRHKIASQFAPFVSGRHSWPAVELQSKVRKLMIPKTDSSGPDGEQVKVEPCTDDCAQAPPALHPPPATRIGCTARTRWPLILSDYVTIPEAVLSSQGLMADTNIQRFELNQKTLSQWFCKRQKERERNVLEQGVEVVPAPAFAGQALPPATTLSFPQAGQGQGDLQEQPGPSSSGLPPTPTPPPLPIAAAAAFAAAFAAAVAAAVAAPAMPPLHAVPLPAVPLPAVSLPAGAPRTSGTAALQTSSGSRQVSASTARRKRRRIAEAAAAAAGVVVEAAGSRRPTLQYTCSKCGQPKTLDTGHTRIAGVSYCAAVGEKTVEEWKEQMRKRKSEDRD